MRVFAQYWCGETITAGRLRQMERQAFLGDRADIAVDQRREIIAGAQIIAGGAVAWIMHGGSGNARLLQQGGGFVLVLGCGPGGDGGTNGVFIGAASGEVSMARVR